jgi:hypothetical protein
MISGKVFNDLNGDGISLNDPGVKGVIIELRNSRMEKIASTESKNDGSYAFDEVNSGVYVLLFKKFANAEFSLSKNSKDPSLDSDVTRILGGELGATENIQIKAGQYLQNIDAGLFMSVEVSGKVFYDNNLDGIATGESALGNILVLLFNTKGFIVETTRTMEDGSYKFSNLKYGYYTVGFKKPLNLIFSPANASSKSESSAVIRIESLSPIISVDQK